MHIRLPLILLLLYTSSFSKGEVSKIFAHKENATNATYDANGHQHKWGRGKNLVIDGFEYNEHRYEYVSDSPIVKIRRVDNVQASGEPCGLFAERKENNNYKLNPAFPNTSGDCDMAKVMGGRIINVGALDLFKNVSDGWDTAKNIERVDFISPQGIIAPVNSMNLSKAGHVVTEKSGNNYIQIAAILSLDANGDPASFGPLVMVHKSYNSSSEVRYGLCKIYLPDNSYIYGQRLGFYRDSKIDANQQGEPWHLGNSYEALGMAFVTLKDLGVSTAQKYYGFSYFGKDVTEAHTLTDISTYPTTTSGDTADPYGGVASYFMDEEIIVPHISINDISKLEGDSDTIEFEFTVSLDQVADSDVSFWYKLTDGSDGNESEYIGAIQNDEGEDAAQDYVGASGYITIPAGDNNLTITVDVVGDIYMETDERFFVDLYEATENAVIDDARGDGIIINDDNGVPFTCSPEAYLFTGSGESSSAYKIDLSEQDSNPLPLNNSMTNRINATGYNVKDNFIWGYEINDHKVIKIDSQMEVVSYSVEGLYDGTYYAGDVSQDGILYLKVHNIDRLYKVNLNDGTPKYIGHVDLNKTGINLGDFAFNPIDDKLYAISESDGHLYSVNPSNGDAEDLGSIMPKEDVKFHTFIFDRSGNLYFYGSEGIIRKIDLSLGREKPYSASLFSTTSVKVGGGDGAKCPNSEVPQPEPILSISEYHFDECLWSGIDHDVIDSTGTNNAKVIGDANSTSFGVISRSGQFSGEGYVDTGDSFNDIFGAGNNEFTITAWINPSVLSNSQTNHKTKNTFIAKAANSTNDNLEIGVNPNGTLHLYLDTEPKNKYSDFGNAGDISIDSWHFVAISYKDGFVKVQIDDKVYENSTTWKNANNIKNAVGSPFTIGSSQNIDNYFTGSIDEVKIFDKLLNADELNSVKDENGDNRESEVCPTRVIFEYRFDECEYFGIANEVKDSIGSNHGKAIDSNTDDNAKINRSALFCESNIEVEPNFSIANKPFAISFWMNPKTVPESRYMGILSKEVEFYLRDDRKVSINLKNSSDDLVSSDSINLNEWNHVVLSSDGESVKLYINGTQKASSSDANNSGIDGINNLIIGKTPWEDSELFNGNIDELKIFDGAITNDILQNIISDSGADREDIICLSSIGCKEEAIVIDDTKYVHEVDLATGKSVTYTMSDEQIGGASVNGFGFNVKDGYLWGSDVKNKGYLVRIGKDENGEYSQEKIGPIAGLPEGKSTFIGDVNNNGHLYLYYKNPLKMFVVNLDRNSTDYNYTEVIDSFELDNLKIADMAFNPIDNQLYAIESDDDFYKIDIDNKRVSLLKRDVINLQNGTYGTSFFDSSGFFYAVKNSTRDVVRVMFRDDENGTFVKASIFSDLINENAQQTNIDGGRCNLYPILIDYGDAPDSYKTSLDGDGARHKISVDEPLVFFGDGVDNDPDAWILDKDSDDGLVDNRFDLLYTSMDKFTATIKVKNDTEVNANIVGWIDFNGDGGFDEKEGASSVIMLKRSQEIKLTWDVPDDIKKGETYVRFRVSTDPLTVLDTHGVKGDGEVEDYKISIKEGNVYDAWGFSDGDIENPVIHTKIINETIVLRTVSLNRNRTEMITHAFKNVKAGLFAKDGSVISNYQDINTTNPYDMLYFEDINSSYKYVYVNFQYDDDLNITHESNATDPFAIRPRNYVLQTYKNPSEEFIRAGQDFNITIKVEDFNGNFTNSYDENGSMYKIDYNETKESDDCVRGVLDDNKTNFSSGLAKFETRYSEVGELNIKVSEVEGKEFAIIDKDDGSGDHRFIDESTVFDVIHPVGVNAVFFYETINNKDHTYYGSDPSQMGVIIDVNTTVVNENNETLKNFSDGCYADDIDFKLEYQYIGDGNPLSMLFRNSDLTDATSDVTVVTNGIQYGIDKQNINLGKVSRRLYMNFGRSSNIPVEPSTLALKNTKAEILSSKVFEPKSALNKTITFLYARSNIPDQNTVGKTLNVRVDYEVYCKTCIKDNFGLSGYTESIDSVNWYILPSEDDLRYSSERLLFGNANILASAKDNLIIVADKTPHKNKIVYRPESYLVYNRTNASATEHRFNASFDSNGTQWNGKGAKLGITVDQDVSGRGLRKMDW